MARALSVLVLLRLSPDHSWNLEIHDFAVNRPVGRSIPARASWTALRRSHTARCRSRAATCILSTNSQQLLGYVLGKTRLRLAVFQLFPHHVRIDAGRNPQDHQIIKEISTFLDHGIATATHGVDHDLDGFFGELFCDFAATGAKEPRCPGGRRIVVLARLRFAIKPRD